MSQVSEQVLHRYHEVALSPPPRYALFFHKYYSTQREVEGQRFKDPSSGPTARRWHYGCLNHFQVPWTQSLAVYLALHGASWQWLWLLLLF